MSIGRRDENNGFSVPTLFFGMKFVVGGVVSKGGIPNFRVAHWQGSFGFIYLLHSHGFICPWPGRDLSQHAGFKIMSFREIWNLFFLPGGAS